MDKFNIYTAGPLYKNKEFTSIYSAVEWAQDHLPLKRGWKVRRNYELVPHTKTKALHECIVLNVVNTKGRVVNTVRVVGVKSAIATHVRSPWDNSIVYCDCGSDNFYSLGRSLDYNNWQCAECGRSKSTLTETGMSR